MQERETQRKRAPQRYSQGAVRLRGYRYFTVIKVTTQVVNHCILSHQTPQDAVGGQSVSDTVYKEIVTIACSRKVRNMAKWDDYSHPEGDTLRRLYSNYLYYFTPISSIN